MTFETTPLKMDEIASSELFQTFKRDIYRALFKYDYKNGQKIEREPITEKELAEKLNEVIKKLDTVDFFSRVQLNSIHELTTTALKVHNNKNNNNQIGHGSFDTDLTIKQLNKILKILKTKYNLF